MKTILSFLNNSLSAISYAGLDAVVFFFCAEIFLLFDVF